MVRAVVVTSGGIDSITNGLMMLKEGYEVFFLHANYGQKSELAEKLACRKITSYLKEKGYPVSLWEVDIPFIKEISKTSALVQNNIKVPLGMDSLELSSGEIGELWVPSRNIILLSFGCALAEELEAEYVTLGCNVSEIGYKDNTKEFLDRFTYMAEYGTLKHTPKFISPEWEMDKPQIIKWGFDNGFGEIYKWTWSCDEAPHFITEKINISREDLMAEGKCGCCMNRRFSFFVAEKLWGIEDNQTYVFDDYFRKVYLPELTKRCTEKMWMYKYLSLLR